MIDMYDLSIKPLIRNLDNLSRILRIGEKHAVSKKFDPNLLPQCRLIADMYPLINQVQIATDISKGAAARLSGTEIPKYEDNETTFDELQARIAKTIAFLDSIEPNQLVGSESKPITLTIRNIDLKFTGQDYLLKWVMPNVYFHVTTAYNILRHNGVDLGKSDYLGPRK